MIFILENDANIRKLIAYTLNTHGYECTRFDAVGARPVGNVVIDAHGVDWVTYGLTCSLIPLSDNQDAQYQDNGESHAGKHA